MPSTRRSSAPGQRPLPRTPPPWTTAPSFSRQTHCSEQLPQSVLRPEAAGSQLADRVQEALPHGSAERQRSAVAVGSVADHDHVIAGYFDAAPAASV